MPFDFTGQTALVTGATRGIGAQIAQDLARLGARLVLTGANLERVDALRRGEAERAGHQWLQVDFADPASTDAFLAEIAAFERIDVVVNNAGTNKIALVEDTDPTDWDNIIAVNLSAPYKVTRAVVPAMKRNGYGRIVNIASIWGVISKAKRTLYSTSKFGLRGLTVTTAVELAPFNVLVNAVSPGFTLTELTRKILGEEQMAELARQVPMGRMAKPEEISRAVLFLASNLNTYICAQNLVVDGGFVHV